MRQIYDIKDNKVIVNLPESFRNKKKVMVTVDDEISGRTEKINLMKKASHDPLYLADIAEIEDAFNFADSEE